MSNICIVGKAPPIQGGVSSRNFNVARSLAIAGHQVHLITNAGEVECGYRETLLDEDLDFIGNTPRLRIHNLDDFTQFHHIPNSPAYLSRLFGKSVEVIESFNCSVIIGWYFEPYCLAASFAANATGTPLIAVHAGSDLGRLSRNRDLFFAYKAISSNTSRIVTTANPLVKDIVKNLGFLDNQIVYAKGHRLPCYFLNSSSPLDIQSFHDRLNNHLSKVGINSSTINALMNKRRVDYEKFCIGSYGKIGHLKGSYSLISALNNLAKTGYEFNFFISAAGHHHILTDYVLKLSKMPALLERTWLLPPMAPWRIPSFIDRLHATCFLEHAFPIPFHTPILPREILSRGSCLILSKDIYDKQPAKANFVDGKNFILIDNPENVDKLSERIDFLMRNRQACKDIGLHGKYLSETIESFLSEMDSIIECTNELLREN